MSDTSTDPRRTEWAINDDIVRLRRWGTNEMYDLPAVASECIIGSSPTCTIHLNDSRVSSEHARLLRDQDHNRWNLLDLRSKNGVRVDGIRQYTARLEPCMELGLGRLTLIAESPRSIELRCFLARMLGWGSQYHEVVDTALREIRSAQARREPFVLQSDGPLYSVARDIHHHLHGEASPFVACDARLPDSDATVLAPRNVRAWWEAVVAARGGTLCIPNDHPPEPLSKFLEEVRDWCVPTVQVIICAAPHEQLCIEGSRPIVIPELEMRAKAQLDHIIVEYAADVAKKLGSEQALPASARAWVLANAARPGRKLTLEVIYKAVMRLTVFYLERQHIAPAARRLGINHKALEQWLERRPPIPGKRTDLDGEEDS